MPKGMQPIYTQVVGAGGTASIAFNNIPQDYTDLAITISARTTWNANNWDDIFCQVNNATSADYSSTTIYGIASGVTASRGTGGTTLWSGWCSNANCTANVFGFNSIYITNYSSTSLKQINTETCSEGNSVSQVMGLIGALARTNAPITNLRFFSANSSSFVQHTSISLYGISR